MGREMGREAKEGEEGVTEAEGGDGLAGVEGEVLGCHCEDGVGFGGEEDVDWTSSGMCCEACGMGESSEERGQS